MLVWTLSKHANVRYIITFIRMELHLHTVDVRHVQARCWMRAKSQKHLHNIVVADDSQNKIRATLCRVYM